MKLILKIALGVCLGIFAALFLPHLPKWLKQQQEDNAFTTVATLTPSEVVARCGKPVAEIHAVDPDDASTDRWRLFYSVDSKSGLDVMIGFHRSQDEKRWYFDKFANAFMADGHFETAQFGSSETFSAMVNMLPCLKGK